MNEIIALLVVGHVLGDFLLQTGRMAREKGTHLVPLAQHVGLVALAHFVCAVPILDARGVGLLLAVVALHFAIDFTKGRLDRQQSSRLLWFALDQLAHAVVLLGAIRLWDGTAPWIDVPDELRAYLPMVATCVSVYVFAGNGGATIVASLLSDCRAGVPETTGEDEKDGVGLGRSIGILERLLITTLVIFDAWGAIGFVIAAKSIARFRKLDDQVFAEYYLVGTLASVLVAVGLGLIVRGVV